VGRRGSGARGSSRPLRRHRTPARRRFPEERCGPPGASGVRAAAGTASAGRGPWPGSPAGRTRRRA
jgi:hypothetical protein